jgi:hypothetical protein
MLLAIVAFEIFSDKYKVVFISALVSTQLLVMPALPAHDMYVADN